MPVETYTALAIGTVSLAKVMFGELGYLVSLTWKDDKESISVMDKESFTHLLKLKLEMPDFARRVGYAAQSRFSKPFSLE